MNYLLDTNAVVAMLAEQHEHHERVHRFVGKRRFGISPQVQLGVLRYLTHERNVDGRRHPPLETPLEALRKLRVFCNTRAKFIPDALDACAVDFASVTGAHQWNDFYLAALARHHRLRLATCDGGLCLAFPDLAVLIPRLGG